MKTEETHEQGTKTDQTSDQEIYENRTGIATITMVTTSNELGGRTRPTREYTEKKELEQLLKEADKNGERDDPSRGHEKILSIQYSIGIQAQKGNDPKYFANGLTYAGFTLSHSEYANRGKPLSFRVQATITREAERTDKN